MGRWLLGTVMLVAGAVYSLFVAPAVLVLMVGAVAAAVLALSRPKAFVGVVLGLMLFSRTIPQLAGIPALASLDEAGVLAAVVLLSFRRWSARAPLRWPAGTKWFLAFAAFGIVSAALSGLSLPLIAQATFLGLKWFLFAVAVAQVDWEVADLRPMRRLGVALGLALMVAGAINLALPGTWNGLFQTSGFVDYRGGLPSIVGLFVHPLEMGAVVGLLALAAIGYYTVVRKRGATLIFAGAMLVEVVLTFRRTAIVGIGAALALMATRINRTGAIVGAVLAGPPLLALSWGPLMRVVNYTYVDYLADPGSARTLMTVDAFDVASNHFPLGAGFGRFGSFIAAQEYSPEYVELGYKRVWGLSEASGNDRFLTDTQWPALIAEPGYLGAACFVVGLFLMWRQFSRITARTRDAELRWFGITAQAWMVLLLVGSIAIPVFFVAPYFPLLGLVLGMGAAFAETKEASTEEALPRDVEASTQRSRTGQGG